MSKNEVKMYKITDMDGFQSAVFGADDLLGHFPALADDGVPMLKQGAYFYIVDKEGRMISDSAFFSGDEMRYLALAD